MARERAMMQNEARARRLASSLALVGGMLFGDPETAAATPDTTGGAMPIAGAPPPPSALPSSIEPTADAHEADAESSGGLPRSLVYGAAAGLFLFVAAGLAAHRKH
jgi:hypothetical protein